MTTHAGDKPFFCKYCHFKVVMKSAVKIHERIHTGEKPYSCKFCEKKFARKKYLSNHKLSHE